METLVVTQPLQNNVVIGTPSVVGSADNLYVSQTTYKKHLIVRTAKEDCSKLAGARMERQNRPKADFVE